MMKRIHISFFLTLSTILLFIPHTTQLQTSQAWTLLRIQHLLGDPTVVNTWTNYTDFCNTEPTSSLTIVCYEESITQLHISGDENSPPLPRNFSIDSFFTTVVRLPDLKVLSLSSLGLWGPLPAKISRLSSLEILNLNSNYFYGPIPEEVSLLRNLATLILDNNMFEGSVPDWLSALPLLTVVSLRNNSLSGTVPDSLRTLDSLRVLALSSNHLSGDLPDFSSLTNLQELDLENNHLGPQFPILGRKVATLILRNNSFSAGIPSEVSSYFLLEQLDVSLNRFVGPFLPALLSLPSITYLNISGNRFTGMLFQNMSCNDELETVDLSSNLLTGNLPSCLEGESRTTVLFSRNCLDTSKENQNPYSFCRNEALAVGILPRKRKKVSTARVVLVVSAVVGIIGAVVLVGMLVLFVYRRFSMKRAMRRPPRRLIENASNGVPLKLLSDARYISQTMRLGALGIANYRSFSLEEIEEATNNFETSNFLGENSYGQREMEVRYSLGHKESHPQSGWLKAFNFFTTGLFPVGMLVLSNGSRENNNILERKKEDKVDVYNFGIILLEIISGRPITTQSDVDWIKDQLQASIGADGAARRRSMIDPMIRKACSDESLKTVMEICINCLSKAAAERPSVEDVLWNLQFAAQVQDAWRGGDSQSSEGSPISPSQLPQSLVTLQ
ncbi:putative inactive leucine-rich repeat receptor-like protein kinase [Acorus gramineus]|uniref:Inactive leucine-rich repeat receptor-like protein kinase n=1 Tax=Acorus gramineus TaxID=55184 RepID=A0AAV9AHP7_ACOGR|nr:putative inactive leucine-rich repeat receptor-like protein kinase [Acorus gramineus]